MSGKLIDLKVSELLNKFGAGSHKPGSGSAAALQGMLSAQLLLTVIELTNKPKYRKFYEKKLPDLLKIDTELRNRLFPELEKLFQEDSELFDQVIQLRRERDKQTDVLEWRRLNQTMLAVLMPATEIPIRIAKMCLEIAKFSLQVFDYGFRKARGDSGVALSGAQAALSGCLSIVELNLLSFEADEWAENIQASCDGLRVELDALAAQAQNRLSQQFALAKRRAFLSLEIRRLAAETKKKRPLSEADIEEIATQLQRLIWVNKDLIWKNNTPDSAFQVLKPEIVLEQLGFITDHLPALERHMTEGVEIEVAGQIDQQEKLVLISKQFTPLIQNFTAAHELGHSLLHTQNVLHRDRPIDGSTRRDGDEWQADKFAAYFLMPKKLVRKTFFEIYKTTKFRITNETAFALKSKSPEELRNQCRDSRGLARLLADAISYQTVSFRSLSERFGVSIEAMAIRLEELELVEF